MHTNTNIQKLTYIFAHKQGYEPDIVPTENFNIDEFIAVLSIEGNFIFEKATYADFKSALITTLGGDKGQVRGMDVFIFDIRIYAYLYMNICAYMCEYICIHTYENMYKLINLYEHSYKCAHIYD